MFFFEILGWPGEPRNQVLHHSGTESSMCLIHGVVFEHDMLQGLSLPALFACVFNTCTKAGVLMGKSI